MSWRSTIADDLYASCGRRGALGFAVALFSNPGFSSVLLYRASRAALRLGPLGKVLSVLIWRFNIATTACHLHPKSKAGPGLVLPHPVGVVFGEGAVLGRGVTIYQGVTLGTSAPGTALYPTIGDGAVIFPGAVVVGKITVGRAAKVGANSFVSQDVPDNATAVGSPARIIAGSTN